MAKKIVVQAPAGFSLDLDYDEGTIKAVPSSSERNEYLVLAPKPGQTAPQPTTSASTPGGRTWPIPPVIMSFRSPEALSLEARQGAPRAHGASLLLSELAEELGDMRVDEVRGIVLTGVHGG
jgi:hypothetical protein